MKVELTRTFTFSAAHELPAVPDGHKCREVHGHNFVVEIAVYGEVDPRSGWLMDFGDLTRVVQPVIRQLDHHLLNEISGLENPTSENLARWIWDQLTDALPGLSRVTISETPGSGCTYRGEA
jgi:6-pyruvoyltetrahydropterin/6-carboxytetrahydropterin synthase